MMIAYKAFAPDLSCTVGEHRFQYQKGIWNEEPAADCAVRGFHCAENPLDCLTYYSCWKDAVYYLVLAAGDINEDAMDSRISCTRLKLVKQLSLEEFVLQSLHFLMQHPKRKPNGRIRWECGEAHGGFALVRGKNPRARGSLGDVLGFAREDARGRTIEEAGVFCVDGKQILPGIWYDVKGVAIGGK